MRKVVLTPGEGEKCTLENRSETNDPFPSLWLAVGWNAEVIKHLKQARAKGLLVSEQPEI